MNQAATKKVLLLISLTMFGAGVLAMSARAENMMQNVEMVKVDVQKLSTGYRSSKVIGSNVVNDANETIGKVDDLIVSPDDNKSAYVIISVGGWLGMGTRLVALPYANLQITSTKIALPGVTKDGLKNLPEFKYITT